MRYLYGGLLIIAIGIAVLFAYRTSAPPAEPAAQAGAQFGGVSLRIDYATTEEEREKGLGGRVSIPNNYGMLFVFPKDDYYGFWMKDMFVPIDIFWLDNSAEGGSASGGKGQLVVVSMKTYVATSSYPNVFYSNAPARYVLETVAGFAQAHAVATGTTLSLKNFPSVSE